MKKGLTRAGVGNISSVWDFIDLASRYGFDAVDLDENDLRELTRSADGSAITHSLAKSRVQLGSLSLPVEWRGTEGEFLDGFARLPSVAEQASRLGCMVCCTYFLPSIDENPAYFMAVATRRLRLCADVLDAYGLRLGIEYVGPYHLRKKWANPFIWDLQGTLEWIRAIDKKNVGLLLDSIHWYTSGGSVEDILSLSPSQVVHVHLNDAPDVPICEVLDNDRLFPSDGVIQLVDFLHALKTIDYRGIVAQEVLTSAPLREDSHKLLARSKSAYAELWRAIGLS